MNCLILFLIMILSSIVIAQSRYFDCELSRKGNDFRDFNDKFKFQYPKDFQKSEIGKDLRFLKWKLKVEKKGDLSFYLEEKIKTQIFSFQEEQAIDEKSIILFEKKLLSPDKTVNIKLQCSPEKKAGEE